MKTGRERYTKTKVHYSVGGCSQAANATPGHRTITRGEVTCVSCRRVRNITRRELRLFRGEEA